MAQVIAPKTRSVGGEVKDGKSHGDDVGLINVVYGASGFEEDDRFAVFAKVAWVASMLYVLGMFASHGPYLLSQQGIAVSTCTGSLKRPPSRAATLPHKDAPPARACARLHKLI